MSDDRSRLRLVTSPALIVAILLAALFLQAVLSMRLLSATFDETTHLPSGYTYWKTGKFRLNPQHPPLVKLLSAAPLLFLEPALDLQDPGWLAQPPDEWGFGYRFLYSNDADRLLFWGRFPVVLLALLMAGYVYRWARDLFGTGAGLISLFLCAFSPTVIAHGHLVTFDVGLACFSTMALYHFWRYARGGSGHQLGLAGVGLGLALASKFSAVILLGAFVLLAAFAVIRPPGPGGRAAVGAESSNRRGRGLIRAVVALALVFAVAAAVVQASYFFTANPLIYLEGMSRVNADHNPHYAYYLMGQFKEGGWWYYFLAAFLLKTPAPTLILLGLAVVSIRRYPAAHALDELFLVVPVVLFVGVTSVLAGNLGIRYILPVYPLLFIFIGRLARALPGRLPVRALAALLGAWYLWTTLAIFPDHLAYFNDLVGGPARGHHYLDDSNIDWGQDAKRLKHHLDANGIDRVKLRYGRHTAPGYYGIDWEPVTREDWEQSPSPGVYAIGTHVLIRGEHWAKKAGVRTDWLSRHEPIARIGFSCWLFEFDQGS